MNSLFLLIILFSCCGNGFGRHCCQEEKSCCRERREDGCGENNWCRDNGNRGNYDRGGSDQNNSCGCDRPTMGPSCPPPPPMPRNQFPYMENEPRTCGCEEQ